MNKKEDKYFEEISHMIFNLRLDTYDYENFTNEKFRNEVRKRLKMIRDRIHKIRRINE